MKTYHSTLTYLSTTEKEYEKKKYAYVQGYYKDQSGQYTVIKFKVDNKDDIEYYKKLETGEEIDVTVIESKRKTFEDEWVDNNKIVR